LKSAEKWCAPCAHGQDAAKQNNGVDADASVARPVGIRFQIQPEGKLVEGQSRANPVADGHQTAEEYGQRRVRAAQIQEPSISHEKKNKDAPHKVVDVKAADHHPPKWAVVMNHQADNEPHSRKGDQERDGSDEHAAAGPVRDGRTHQESEAGQLKQNQQHDDYHAGEG